MSNSIEIDWREELSKVQTAVNKRVASRTTIIKEAAKDVVEDGRGVKSSLDITLDPFYQRVVTANPKETFTVKTNLGKSAQQDLVGEKTALMFDASEASRLDNWGRYLENITGPDYDNVERKASLLEDGIADLDKVIKGRKVAGVDTSKLETEREDLKRGLEELRRNRPQELEVESAINPNDKVTPLLIQTAKSKMSQVSGKAMYAPIKDGLLGSESAIEARKELESQRAQREAAQLRLAQLMGDQPQLSNKRQILVHDWKPLINRSSQERISTAETNKDQAVDTSTPLASKLVVEKPNTTFVPIDQTVTVLPVESKVGIKEDTGVNVVDELVIKGSEDLGPLGRAHFDALVEAAKTGSRRKVQQAHQNIIENEELSEPEWEFLNNEANKFAEEVRVAATRSSHEATVTVTKAVETTPEVAVSLTSGDKGRNRWSLANVASTIRNTTVNLINAIRQNRRKVITTTAIVGFVGFIAKNIFTPS